MMQNFDAIVFKREEDALLNTQLNFPLPFQWRKDFKIEDGGLGCQPALFYHALPHPGMG